MKTLYIECGMGAAGDMLMAALLELHPDPKGFLDRLNDLGIPKVHVESQLSVKCGITGTHISVKIDGKEEKVSDHHHHSHDDHSHDHGHHSHDDHSHDHDHHSHDDHDHNHHHHSHDHGSFDNIKHLIGHLNISDKVKKDTIGVYKLIAEAESHAHGVPVSQVHFHEVGEMDAIADIIGVCMLIEDIAPDEILASPVNVGSGYVRCSHGILPVPAPATAFILQNIPMYSDQIIESELCTPTGAALLKYFVSSFCKMPVITVAKLGYGMGKKDFKKANCVRVYLGETNKTSDEVVELVCNLDDMTPEAIAFAQQLLLDENALDVYTSPIGMKKGRMGISFTCMCNAYEKDKMMSLMFKHTTTLGIREYSSRRWSLQKDHDVTDTKYGSVKIKTSHGFGVKKTKPEFDDLAGIARKNDVSIAEVLKQMR